MLRMRWCACMQGSEALADPQQGPSVVLLRLGPLPESQQHLAASLYSHMYQESGFVGFWHQWVDRGAGQGLTEDAQALRTEEKAGGDGAVPGMGAGVSAPGSSGGGSTEMGKQGGGTGGGPGGSEAAAEEEDEVVLPPLLLGFVRIR